MKRIRYIIKNEFINIIFQTKNLLVLFFVVIAYESIISVILEIARRTQLTVSILEPFILLVYNRLNIIALPIIFISLICSFPVCELDYYGMIRLEKKIWFMGEAIFVFLFAFLFLGVVYLGTIIVSGNRLSYSFDWGTLATSLPKVDYNAYMNNRDILLGAEVQVQGKPIEVFVYSFVSMLIYLYSVGMTVLFGISINRKWFGVILSIIMTSVGGVSLYLSGKMLWIIPLRHCMFGEHFNQIYSKQEFSLWGSLLYLSAWAIVISCITYMNTKIKNIGE